MKIAILNTVPYGSTGRISKNIGERAKLRGHEVVVVNGWTKKKQKAENASEVIATGLLSKTLHLGLAKLTSFDGCFSILPTLRLIRRLKKLQPDLLHLHIMHDYFLSLPLLFRYIERSGTKVLWTFHDCWAFTGGCPYFTLSGCDGWKSGCMDCPEGKKYDRLRLHAPKKMWGLKKRISENNNICIATPSQWLGDLVAKSFWSQADCRVMKNGLNLDVFQHRESDFRAKFSCDGKFIVLGVAFDWGVRKGLDVFNELAELLPPEYQIVLVGTNEAIDQQINSKIISIHKTADQKELAEIYSAADVFVNPTREDNFPTVNIEALACGTPIITFQTGGSVEAVANDDCGIVVEDRTASGLVDPIREVCTSRQFDRMEMKRWVSKFDETDCYDQYVDLYECIITK